MILKNLHYQKNLCVELKWLNQLNLEFDNLLSLENKP